MRTGEAYLRTIQRTINTFSYKFPSICFVEKNIQEKSCRKCSVVHLSKSDGKKSYGTRVALADFLRIHLCKASRSLVAEPAINWKQIRKHLPRFEIAASAADQHWVKQQPPNKSAHSGITATLPVRCSAGFIVADAVAVDGDARLPVHLFNIAIMNWPVKFNRMRRRRRDL